MAQALPNSNQEEWLKVLGKGMVTLPKKWRDELGIVNGDIVKAKKEGNKVVIEAKSQIIPTAPYRVYSTDEINKFLEDDKLSKELTKKAQKKLSALR
jgi:AbrB family looped-hinge helix DNA binding protein